MLIRPSLGWREWATMKDGENLINLIWLLIKRADMSEQPHHVDRLSTMKFYSARIKSFSI